MRHIEGRVRGSQSTGSYQHNESYRQARQEETYNHQYQSWQCGQGEYGQSNRIPPDRRKYLDKQRVASRNQSVQVLTVLVSEMLYKKSLLAELAMYTVILSLCCFTLPQFQSITQP